MRTKRISLTPFLIIQIEKDITDHINVIRIEHLRGWHLGALGVDNRLQELGQDIIDSLNNRLGLTDDANS
ncbi:MAG: hypothetical protein DRQ01_00875 [Ignavibacteriae bacterium]|nr:MAG: hypothetical protein DRQ01_00875 [Ignavibacteriota bacterium]